MKDYFFFTGRDFFVTLFLFVRNLRFHFTVLVPLRGIPFDKKYITLKIFLVR